MVNLRDMVLLFFLLLFNFDFTLEQVVVESPSSPVKRAALLQLRSSLGLRSKEWPIKGDPCFNWSGVRCQNGSVVGINISGFRRSRLGKQNPKFDVEALANLTLLVVGSVAWKIVGLGSVTCGWGWVRWWVWVWLLGFDGWVRWGLDLVFGLGLRTTSLFQAMEVVGV